MDSLLNVLNLLKDPALILSGLVIVLFYRLMIKKEDSLEKMRVTLGETVALLNKLFDARRHDDRG